MPRSYVNNASNRSLGRVGMPLGSMPQSRTSGASASGSTYSSSSSPGQTRTYVDNSYNRQHDRVGLEKGTKVISGKKSNGQTSSLGTGQTRTYVDNDYNRQHDRVGLEMGTKVISAKTTSALKPQSNESEPRRYVDNPKNRREGRVGKVIGTHIPTSGEKKTYEDNVFNRKHGRVGKPRGSCPVPNKSKTTKDTADRIEMMITRDPVSEREPLYEEEILYHDDEVLNNATCAYNRMLEEMEWKDKTEPPRTRPEALKDFTGNAIPYSSLDMGRKIGQGGFGEVYFAKWCDTVVAVKKLQIEKISKKRIEEFAEEIEKYGQFDHQNIVKFFGACVEMPHLAIVMEYMDMSLFDALHIKGDIELKESDRLLIIRQTIEGVKYLHEKGIAHCDLKSPNVLMNHDDDEVVAVKLTDFGLSVVKFNSQTSVSCAVESVQNRGTPRYSAPEVLRGDMLNVNDMMKADMYSLSLILFEVVYEEEPFYDLSYQQLQKQVGENGLPPNVPVEPEVEGDLINMIRKLWSFKPEHRPDIDSMKQAMCDRQRIYSIV